MYEPLFKYIKDRSTTPLTDKHIEFIKEVLVPKKLRKRQYFLQEGEVCKYMAFIVKGAMRQYSIDDNGKEHIVRLLIENWWAGDRESYTMLTPSIYHIDAWEETDLLLVTNADLIRLSSIPAFAEMKSKMDERYSFASQKRLTASISFTAERRYAELERDYPEFIQRFPQHLIASYLGITKETLSRIRSQAIKK